MNDVLDDLIAADKKREYGPMLYDTLQSARDFIAEIMTATGDADKIADACSDIDFVLALARGEPPEIVFSNGN